MEAFNQPSAAGLKRAGQCPRSKQFTLPVFILFLLLPAFLLAQSPKIPIYLEVTMYKVNQGKTDAYLNLVKNYGQRIHQAMVRDNKILGWYFYEVVLSPVTTGSYDFVGVKVTTGFSDMIDNSLSLKEYYAKIKGPKDPAFEQIASQLQEYRVPVKKEIFIYRAGLDPKTPVSKYVQVDYMKPLPGKRDEYVKMEAQVFYPIHQERIKIGALTDWALYEKFLPFALQSEYDFVTANFFDNPHSIIDPKYEEAFNNIPNNIDFIRLSGQIDQTRALVRSDIWKLVLYTDK
ncbi:hypothetical protein [Flavihumibacter sp. CACIAM 22H1]|uniref:hypothetical protein n=1 Tax=Flavihumibacter sp. CACIAM 22H1 TaxID=1812911 RepID=UPI0007A86151|nr:hypothetical protein [Flavihumibacter sp. CACIAM 22H1]KYP14516.1 MAG: hypothetical protein A1D16_15450 [Flavihumibacter sp. CACIAM 22H1]